MVVVPSSLSGGRESGSRELPPRASLENLRNQAKTLQKQHREGNAEALARVSVWLGPDAQPSTLEGPAVRPSSGVVTPLRLHDAQFVLAREYGFASWPRLVEHFEAQQSRERVRRENGRVWIEGVPRLRWGSSPEPTFIGAFEAAFRMVPASPHRARLYGGFVERDTSADVPVGLHRRQPPCGRGRTACRGLRLSGTRK